VKHDVKARCSTAPFRQPDQPGRPFPGSRAAIHDPRWPRIATVLAGLRERGRYSVRIVDADCGAGCLLLHALRHARALGFTAIEGRGIDGSPALVGRARGAADRARDPAIGVAFEVADMAHVLEAEQEVPADILLWHGSGAGEYPAHVRRALRAAADVVIGDDERPILRSMAA
jgi:hypothetical protein